MKEPMSRIVIYGNKKDRKAVLEYLQRRRIMDISESVPEGDEYGFSNMNTLEAQSEFSQKSSMGASALEILNQYLPKKGGMFDSLNGRISLTAAQYYEKVDKISELDKIVQRLCEIGEEISELNGDIVEAKTEMDELEPWLNLDVAADGGGTKTTVCFAGTFSEEISREEILRRYYENDEAPPIHIEIIKKEKMQTYIYILCQRSKSALCEKILRETGFSRPKVKLYEIPRELEAKKHDAIKDAEGKISELKDEAKSYGEKREDIEFYIDYYTMRAEKYDVLSRLYQRKRVFVISGYVPSDKCEDLAATLEHKYNTAVSTESAGDDAPVILKNPYLAEPAETVVETFALPARGEVDPTTIMSVFYYIFFGLMLSDAAYGLIMVLGCGFALMKFKNMELSMKKSLRMFMYCGVSTVFWGIMFGSYFGDAIQVISSTFFGKEIAIPPVWFEPVTDPMRMLMFSFLLGLIHLFTGLAIKMYQCIKARDYYSMVTECVFWYMLVGGGVLYLFRVDMFLSMAGMTTKLPEAAGTIAAVTAILGALGIVLFTARHGGIGKRLAKGAYSLYGATSWLSDILSYSRLLALGLATGVIATVFNKMGSMFGGGIVGFIIFTIVFLVGHTLNLAVNLLGAYVHTNRLQFVEFFGKFYEGGGRPFTPFAPHTKYYKFKEE